MKTTPFFLLFILLNQAIYCQDNFKESIDRLANQYVSEKNNRALVIGLINKEGDVFYTYGETEKGNGIKADQASLFEIGEVSSVFTTSLLSVLASENSLDLNDPVQNYFPGHVNIPVYTEIICEPIEKPHYSTESPNHTAYYCFADPSYHPKQMLLCDLATNTSGLPPYPSKVDSRQKEVNTYSNFSLSALYEFLNKYQTSYPTGLHYDFSPLGIAMLGNGLAWKYNKEYEKLLREKLLDPLQMQNTFLDKPANNSITFLQGHDKKGNKVVAGAFGSLSPALGLHSNAIDLAAFLRVNLNLTKSSIQLPVANTANPRVAITDTKKLQGSYAGLGWTISPIPGNSTVRMTWQQGKTYGFAAYVGFIGEQQQGVVILSNTVSDLDKIGQEILSLMSVQKTNASQQTIKH